MLPGKGISADLEGKRILCGNNLYLSENSITLGEDIATSLESLRRQGKATILVSYDGQCIGIIALSDMLRTASKSIVEELKKAQTDVVLLTGDNKQTADYFAQQIGIKSIYAELLPAQKVEQIQELQNKGRNVCMIGDGVNDAPALKTANVGVAMGSMGSDIAIEAADIALMGDDIAKIPYLKRLSNAAVKMIMTNITISIAFNITAIILSILGVLNPVTGALAHNAGSIAVVLNAALLYERKYL
jgi:P-type E1-E2 ATPase